MFKFFKELFLGKSFKFHTEYTLLETYEKLEVLSERDYRQSSRWKSKHRLLAIEIDPIEKGTVLKFKGDRKANRNTKILVKGTATRDESGSEIKGRVSVSKSTLAVFLIIFVPWLLIGLAGISVAFTMRSTLPIIFSFLPSAFMIIFLLPCRYVQNEIYEKVHHVFGKSKKKKSP